MGQISVLPLLHQHRLTCLLPHYAPAILVLKKFLYSKLTSSFPPQTFAYTGLLSRAALALPASHPSPLPICHPLADCDLPRFHHVPFADHSHHFFLLPLAHFHVTSLVTTCHVLGTAWDTIRGRKRQKSSPPRGLCSVRGRQGTNNK